MYEVHVHALQLLLNMRGGVSSLGWKGTLSLLIHTFVVPSEDAYKLMDRSGTLIHATISGQLPLLEAPSIKSNPLIKYLPSFVPILHTTAGSIIMEIDFLMCLYRDLANIQQELFEDSNVTSDTVSCFIELCLAVEHRTLCSYHLFSDVTPSPQNLVYKGAHLALKLCMSLIFRNFGARSATIISLQSRLEPILIELAIEGLSTCDQHDKRVYIWTVWIGSIATQDSGGYVTQLVKALNSVSVCTWDDLRNILQQFVWGPRLERVPCWELCNRIGLT